MLRTFISPLAHLIVLAPALWLGWHLTTGYPLRVRLILLGVFGLGFVQRPLHRWVRRAETARQASKSESDSRP
jgi:hypothetical protein